MIAENTFDKLTEVHQIVKKIKTEAIMNSQAIGIAGIDMISFTKNIKSLIIGFNKMSEILNGIINNSPSVQQVPPILETVSVLNIGTDGGVVIPEGSYFPREGTSYVFAQVDPNAVLETEDDKDKTTIYL